MYINLNNEYYMTLLLSEKKTKTKCYITSMSQYKKLTSLNTKICNVQTS